MLCLLMSVDVISVFAEQSTTSALSQEDAAKAKAQLEALAKAFGVESVATTTTKTAPVEEHKTIGDVGDKALDMIGSAVASISETLEKIAPNVWRIMINQQYAKAIGGLIVPWGLLLLILLYWKIIRKAWSPEGIEDDSEDFWVRTWIVKIIPCILGFILAIWGCVRLSDSIMFLINPEYYAIRDLITMLLGQASAATQ